MSERCDCGHWLNDDGVCSRCRAKDVEKVVGVASVVVVVLSGVVAVASVVLAVGWGAVRLVGKLRG